MIFRGPFTSSPAISHAARARPPQPGHELHQRRLAAAGRPDHGNEFPLVDLEIEPFDGKRRASAAIHQPHITHLQQGAHRHAYRRAMSRTTSSASLRFSLLPRDLDDGLYRGRSRRYSSSRAWHCVGVPAAAKTWRPPAAATDLAIEIVAGMRLHDRLMVDIEVQTISCCLRALRLRNRNASLRSIAVFAAALSARDVAVDEGAFPQRRGIAPLGTVRLLL